MSSTNAEGWRVPGHGYTSRVAPNDFSPRRSSRDWFCHQKATLLELHSQHMARGARGSGRLICPSALPYAVLSITWLLNSPDLSPSLSLFLFIYFISPPFFFLFLRSAKPNAGKRRCELGANLLMLTLHGESLPAAQLLQPIISAAHQLRVSGLSLALCNSHRAGIARWGSLALSLHGSDPARSRNDGF